MRLIHAELRKVRTTRLWIGLSIGGSALVVLATVAVLLVAGTSEGLRQGLGPITTVEDVQTLVWSGAAMSFFAIVLAATMATGEYRYGTAAGTYLATPSRTNVISAKVLAAIPLGAALGLVGGIVPLSIAAVWFAVKGDALPFGLGVVTAMADVCVQCAYGAALAVCVGAASGASWSPSWDSSAGSSWPNRSRPCSCRRSSDGRRSRVCKGRSALRMRCCSGRRPRRG